MASKLTAFLRFYHLSEGNNIERSVIKIIVTKKIAAQYKYVVNFYIVIYFIEVMIGFMAWILTFTNLNNTFPMYPHAFMPSKWQCFVTRECNMR